MTYSEKRQFVLERKDEFIDWLDDEKIDVYSNDTLDRMYDEWLDDMVELPDFGVLTYGYAYILENLDPTAYRCGYSDFLDACNYMECDYELFDGDYFESERYNNEWEVIDEFIEYMDVVSMWCDGDDDENSN